MVDGDGRFRLFIASYFYVKYGKQNKEIQTTANITRLGGGIWCFHVENLQDERWYTGAKKQRENPIANNVKCRRKYLQHLPIIIRRT